MRILLADSQAKVRFALRVLLERQPGLVVVGEAASTQELLTHAALCCADLLLLDWNLVGPAAELLETMRQDHPDLYVIVLSGRPEAREVALAAGADAFVSKGNPPEHLLAAIAHCCGDGETAQTAGYLLSAQRK
jgi:DNA-binding NarL/FixJ family response regulator